MKLDPVWFDLVVSGKKTVEACPGEMVDIKVGEKLIFTNSQDSDLSVEVIVEEVRFWSDFEAILLFHLQDVFPGYDWDESIEIYKAIYGSTQGQVTQILFRLNHSCSSWLKIID